VNDAAARSGRTIARTVTAAFVAILIALTAFLIWVAHHTRREEMRRGRLLMSFQASSPPDRNCLEAAMGANIREEWRQISQAPLRFRRFNSARHIRVDMTYFADHATMDVFTRDGEPLRTHESQALRGCIGA
jgi:hypothetical protein